MKTVGEIIKEARDKKDYSQRQLALYTGISNTEISKIESGERLNPSPEILKKISDYLNLDYMKLLVVAGYIDEKFKDTQNRFNIPILGTIRAGLPLLAEDNWDGQIEVPTDLKADFALRVVGDSMSWVGIHEGDIAIMKQTSTAQHGQIVAAGANEGEWTATLKFFCQENGTPVLRAANPSYPDIKVNGVHKIIGTLVSVQKDAPTMSTYRDFLHDKESLSNEWNETIEKAISLGLDAVSLRQYLDVLSHIKKT
ncbi:MAG: response transcriptional repressor, RecA-mediated autopeptidase [Clostridia bacterium]|jgi:repressor LexA|nr:response transcriptional repressor, RecA-mediated autopeptidase [Clostridia bacterium]